MWQTCSSEDSSSQKNEGKLEGVLLTRLCISASELDLAVDASMPASEYFTAKCAVFCVFFEIVHSLSPFQCPLRPHALHSVLDFNSWSFLRLSSIVRLEGRTGYLPLFLPDVLPFPLPLAMKATAPSCMYWAHASGSSKQPAPHESKRHATHSSSAYSRRSIANHLLLNSSAT